ncbi:MAG: hypothetical protein KKG00_08475 [Bacteroidetes bacterium]|nr:hypothetical protein [Bacteroidota bacterium]
MRTAYVRVVYVKAKDALLRQQDSIFSELETASALRYRSGETNRLESVTSLAQALEIRNLIQQNEADLNMARQQLQTPAQHLGPGHHRRGAPHPANAGFLLARQCRFGKKPDAALFEPADRDRPSADGT